MALLVRLRMDVGIPFPVTSAIRCAAHDRRVSTAVRAGEGAHTFGRAVDISAAGMAAAEKHEIVAKATDLGFGGVGVRLHGRAGMQMIHLDNMRVWDGFPRPAFWTYA